MKTSELTAALLDYWTGRADGIPEWDIQLQRVPRSNEVICVRCNRDRIPYTAMHERYDPSTNWAQGGPIIERDNIGIEKTDYGACWGAWLQYSAQNGDTPDAIGSTPLIAAMRAKVASVYGDEVQDIGLPA